MNKLRMEQLAIWPDCQKTTVWSLIMRSTRLYLWSSQNSRDGCKEQQCLIAGYQAVVKLFAQLRLLPQVGVFQEAQALFVAGVKPAVDFIQ